MKKNILLLLSICSCFSSPIFAEKIDYVANYEGKSSSFSKYLTWTNEKALTVETITKIIKNKKSKLLDIGAGDGTICRGLTPYFESITAIEPSPALFNALKKSCNTSQYTLIQAPFEKTTWKNDAKFDSILISFALQYIQNYEEELQRIKNLLEEDGKLIVVSFDHKDSTIYHFYRKHIASILGYEIPEPEFIDFQSLLEKYFSVEVIELMTTVKIPNSAEATSIANFIFDTDWKNIQLDVLPKIKLDLEETFGIDAPVIFKNKLLFFVCSKTE